MARRALNSFTVLKVATRGTWGFALVSHPSSPGSAAWAAIAPDRSLGILLHPSRPPRQVFFLPGTNAWAGGGGTASGVGRPRRAGPKRTFPSVEMLPFPNVVHREVQILTHPLQIINNILPKRYSSSASLSIKEISSFAGVSNTTNTLYCLGCM